jgi:hypothetical protein
MTLAHPSSPYQEWYVLSACLFGLFMFTQVVLIYRKWRRDERERILREQISIEMTFAAEAERRKVSLMDSLRALCAGWIWGSFGGSTHLPSLFLAHSTRAAQCGGASSCSAGNTLGSSQAKTRWKTVSPRAWRFRGTTQAE